MSGRTVRPGEVVRMRVNTLDCMAVVDVLNKLGLQYQGMSFSQACSTALSSLLETMRVKGVIPRRDGFEYSDMMAPYATKTRGKRKLDLAYMFNQPTDSIQVPPLSVDDKPAQEMQGDLSPQERYQLLNSRRKEGNLTAAEIQELVQLDLQLNG